ncbi:MAG TPA: hypothetical protein VMH61_03525, partial [Candidatus Acidoferrales bacterium]|nr:hypothetical protein [Candidatus Acidoferrales bacterium]
TQRFLGYLAVLVAPTFARDLDQACEALAARVLRAPWARAGAAAALIVALPLPSTLTGAFRPGIAIRWEFFPVAACDWIEAHDVRGHGMNPFAWGGYLLWRFWPQPGRLPFMDIHQAGTTQDRYAYALAPVDTAAWYWLDRERRFDWVLEQRKSTDPRDHLLDMLDRDSTWALVFTDDVAALYVRRRGSLAALAQRERYHWLAAGEDALGGIGARAYADTSAERAIRAELERQVRDSPWNGDANSLLANLDLHDGEWSGALAHLEAARRASPHLAGLQAREQIARDSLAAQKR